MGLSRKKTILSLADELASCQTSALALVTRSLETIERLRAQGSKAFTRLYTESALAQAAASDRLRNAQCVPSHLCGIPISVKDLCDVQGDVTQAGSRVLADTPPAPKDCQVVARLRGAGAPIVGKTNMTEFAYSNIGTNVACGTPINPVASDCDRVPGGSSSGAAVSVADGSVMAALGSDTGGSIRQPAALCGLCGFKPSQGRVPTEGVTPLSTTFDTLGPLANTVACCAVVDAVLTGEPFRALPRVGLDNLHFGVPQTLVMDDLDPTVSRAFTHALRVLSERGAHVTEFNWPEIEASRWRSVYVDIILSEAYSWHKTWLDTRFERYDPIVAEVLNLGKSITYADYVNALKIWKVMVGDARDRTFAFHAIVMPTVAIVAPPLSTLESTTSVEKIEHLIGRNNEFANFFGFCACTVPCHPPDTLPVGFLVMGPNGTDRQTLAIAAMVEEAFTQAGLG